MKRVQSRSGWKLAFAFACALLTAGAHAATPMDYAAAKALADADEASLDATTRQANLALQRAFLDAAVKACATDKTTAQLENFVVVMRLDASGQVVETWRRGDSALALCVERDSRGKTLFVPPRSPFHTSLEVNFVP